MPVQDRLPTYTVEYSTAQYADSEGGSVQWTALPSGDGTYPITLRQEAGQEPGKLVFKLNANKANKSGNWYPAGATADLSNTFKPDGELGTMGMPAITNALKPFCKIRLKEEDTEVWNGIFLAAEFDVAEESWMLTAMETARWRLSKLIPRGVYWYDPDHSATPVWMPAAIPVFNPGGKRNHYGIEGEADTGLFYHSDYREGAYYQVKHWTLGAVLNYLRNLWYKSSENGIPTVPVVTWAKVTATSHPWLFEAESYDPAISSNIEFDSHFAAAIDEVVRRANGDWFIVDGDLKFYDSNGRSTISVDRGTLHSAPTMGLALSGKINYNWAEAATTVKAYGDEEHFECTVCYDPYYEIGAAYTYILRPSWTADDQADYQSAEIQDLGQAQTKFPGVFQRFKFWEKTDQVTAPGSTNSWTEAFGNDKPTATGQREILAEMVSKSKDSGTETKITAKLWRWNQTVGGVPSFDAAPDSIGIRVHPDGSIEITGHDPHDGPLAGTENNSQVRYPRYLCNTEDATWKTRPFAITITVLGNERPLGESKATGTAYPKDLELRMKDIKYTNLNRYNAIHFIDSTGAPVEDNPAGAQNIDPQTMNKVEDYTAKLTNIAARRLNRVCRPETAGVIAFTGIDFDYEVGMKLEQLAGGNGLPTVQVDSLITGVTHNFEDQTTTLEISNV